jgi:hypothetical protein
LYAALCNQAWQRNEIWHRLKDQQWSCSWRHAGGVIADMLGKGDYIDWYCSGIRGEMLTDIEFAELSHEAQVRYKETEAFVPESMVTDEIREDLRRLGWTVVGNND